MRLLETRFHRLLVVVVVTLGLLDVTKARAQDITFCSLPLPKGIPQAHASFNAIYEFDVDQHGTPINVKPVEEQFTKLKDVQACLAKWSLPQSSLTHLVAVFEWKHGAGWTRLAISGPTIKLTIRAGSADLVVPEAVNGSSYHRNPVERGLVASPELWRWSSFRY
jgi:hypothetical protein